MLKVGLTGLCFVIACLVCAFTATAQIEEDGKKYNVMGQCVGMFDGKKVPVTIYSGTPFVPGQLNVNGELTIPLKIIIDSFENGHLVPMKDSPVPIYMNVDAYSGKLESKMFTHAVNVTWEFVKPGIEFTVAGTLYETEKKGATISFTKNGVNIKGIARRGKSIIWRFDHVAETEKDGERFMAIWVTTPMSKYSIDVVKSIYRIPIPNPDGRKALPPDERIMNTIYEIEKDELVDVYLSTDGLLSRITKSSLLPGEDMPDSRIFSKLTSTRFKGVEFPAVILQKFRRAETYPLGRRIKDKWIPDTSLAKHLRTFKEGDLVEVKLQAEEPNVIQIGMEYFVTSMVPYELPELGAVITVQKGTETNPAIVELTTEGNEEPTTYSYEGWARIEPGQQIWFRPTTRGGKHYLQFVWWKKKHTESAVSRGAKAHRQSVSLTGGIRLDRFTIQRFTNDSNITIEGSAIFVVSTEANGSISSISSPDAFVNGLGLGGYTNCTGEQMLRYRTENGEYVSIKGITFLGIRQDSPRYYDIAFVATSNEAKPAPLLEEKNRLLSMKTDNIFGKSDFRFSQGLLWFGKLKSLPSDIFVIESVNSSDVQDEAQEQQ